MVSKMTPDVDMVVGAERSATDADDGSPSPQQRQQQGAGVEYLKYVSEFYHGPLPSMEVLFTLAWYCEVEMKKSFERQREAGTQQEEADVANTEARMRDLVMLAMPDTTPESHKEGSVLGPFGPQSNP